MIERAPNRRPATVRWGGGGLGGGGQEEGRRPGGWPAGEGIGRWVAGMVRLRGEGRGGGQAAGVGARVRLRGLRPSGGTRVRRRGGGQAAGGGARVRRACGGWRRLPRAGRLPVGRAMGWAATGGGPAAGDGEGGVRRGAGDEVARGGAARRRQRRPGLCALCRADHRPSGSRRRHATPPRHPRQPNPRLGTPEPHRPTRAADHSRPVAPRRPDQPRRTRSARTDQVSPVGPGHPSQVTPAGSRQPSHPSQVTPAGSPQQGHPSFRWSVAIVSSRSSSCSPRIANLSNRLNNVKYSRTSCGSVIVAFPVNTLNVTTRSS